MKLSEGSLTAVCYVVAGSIFSTIILVTVLGNSLVVLALLTNKTLQQPCNYFLASLAFADLGVRFIIIYGECGSTVSVEMEGFSLTEIFRTERSLLIMNELSIVNIFLIPYNDNMLQLVLENLLLPCCRKNSALLVCRWDCW